MTETSENAIDHESPEVHEREHHIVSPRIYIMILLALLVGTAITVWASYVDLGEWRVAPGLVIFWNPIVALAIACTKATLVVLFFMHVKYTNEKLTPLVIVSALFFLGLLLSLSMADYGTRLWR